MADNKNVKLILSVETKGTEEAGKELKRLSGDTTTLAQELGKISRANQLQSLAKEMGALSVKTKDLNGAVAQFDARLKALGATKREVQGLASAFQSAAKEAKALAEAEASAATNGGGAGGLSFGQKLTRLGAQGRNLPSFQLPGMPIATDAISNLTRLSGVLLDVAGKSSVVTAATNLLTPALGAQAAATIGAAAPAAIFVAAFGAIGLALKSLTDATGQNAEAITAYAEAQRALNADIVEGLTTEEAQKKLEDLNESRRLEEELLAKNKAAYAAFEAQATEAGTSIDDFGSTLGKIVFGANAVGDVAKAISADEQAIADQIAASEKNIETFSAGVDTLTVAMESGRLAANDAAEAEKKLAQERSKAALSDADRAGKELAARQKADDATGEQNQKRLDSITDESAVIQAQIDSLTQSGITSEDVTAKIASLTDQLDLLGKESAYISDTALAASKARDAEKKAAKDAEDAQKKAAQEQEQYTKAVNSAKTAYKQATEDIGARLKYALIDNAQKLGRDLDALETKFANDQIDLQTKAGRAERDAYQDQLDDIADIRDAAAKDEAKALEQGDFKALFLARQKGEEELKQETIEEERARLRRSQSSDDALDDLKLADQRQRDARMLGYRYADADAQTARNRELAQARTTQNRALQIAAEGQNAGLKQLANYWQQANNIQAQGIANALKMTGASTAGANANSPFGAFQSQFKAVVRR